MNRNKIYAHCSYVGRSGYNNHTREFFRHLSKYSDIKVRNFTVGKSWKVMNNEPHNEEKYLTDIDKKLLYEQSLWIDKDVGKYGNYKIYQDVSKEFQHNLNIILIETNHHYFYDEYIGPKIAYTVYESTELSEEFIDILKKYDQLWVVSNWQKQCLIKQGYNKNKIKIVPEGVDSNIFYYELEKPYHKLTSNNNFTFFVAGRWDYRKSTKEIIETFINTFNNNEPVNLLLNVDNENGNLVDGFKSTQERLKYYNLLDDRIKILNFSPKDEYVSLIKSSNVFLSCSRSEGWNLPLIEAMASGTPSIYSNCSGQLEFTSGKGIPVNILEERAISDYSYGSFTLDSSRPGNYYEPDFNDLSKKMRLVYENYDYFKNEAIENSYKICKKYDWDNIAKIANNTINDFLKYYKNYLTDNKGIIKL